MTHPYCEYKMLPLMSCLYIRVVYSYLSSDNSISMPLINKTFVGEGGGGGGGRGGDQNIMVIL